MSKRAAPGPAEDDERRKKQRVEELINVQPSPTDVLSSMGGEIQLFPELDEIVLSQVSKAEIITYAVRRGLRDASFNAPLWMASFWRRSCYLEFGSPLRGDGPYYNTPPYRMVLRFQRLLDEHLPMVEPLTDQEAAEVWRNIYMLCTTAIRALLFALQSEPIFQIYQSNAGILSQLPRALREEMRSSLPDHPGYEAGAHEYRSRASPLVISPTDRLLEHDEPTWIDRSRPLEIASIHLPVPRYHVTQPEVRPWPTREYRTTARTWYWHHRLYHIELNTWLCMRGDAVRRYAQGDMFRSTPIRAVGLPWHSEIDILHASARGGAPPAYWFPREEESAATLDVTPQHLLEPRGVDDDGDPLWRERFVRLSWAIPDHGVDVPYNIRVLNINGYLTWTLLMPATLGLATHYYAPGASTRRVLLGRALGDGRVMFETDNVPVMRGRVYCGFEYMNQMQAEPMLRMQYALFIDGIDMDAALDWLDPQNREGEAGLDRLAHGLGRYGLTITRDPDRYRPRPHFHEFTANMLGRRDAYEEVPMLRRLLDYAFGRETADHAEAHDMITHLRGRQYGGGIAAYQQPTPW